MKGTRCASREPRDEKFYENKIIKMLQGLGWAADHIDCGVDGFPDILALKGVRAIQIEVKDGSRGDRLVDLFEPSQPVYYGRMKKVGVYPIVVIGYEKKFYTVLYGIEVFTAIASMGDKFADATILDIPILRSKLDETATRFYLNSFAEFLRLER